MRFIAPALKGEIAENQQPFREWAKLIFNNTNSSDF